MPYIVQGQAGLAMWSRDLIVSFYKVSSMILHLPLSALDLGELKERKIWKKLWISKEEPTAPATQTAFELKENPLIPVFQG